MADKDKKKEKKKDKGGSSATATSAASPSATQSSPPTFDLVRINADLEEIWKRKLAELPVYKDLPRLMKGLQLIVDQQIYSNATESAESEEEATSKNVDSAIREFLKALASVFPDKATADFLPARLEQLKASNGEISKQLLSIFESLPSDTAFERILKCIHQKVMFPAVSEMKKISESIPYKDVKGTWRVTVQVSGQTVAVRHSKKERAWDEKSFTFQWQVQIGLDRGTCSKFSSSAQITSVDFASTSPPELKPKFLKYANIFLSPNVEYTSIWSKPLVAHPVHKDLARMTKNLVVMDSDGLVLYAPAPDSKEEKHKSVTRLLLKLAEVVDEKLVPALTASIEKLVKPEGDLTQQLLQLMESLPESSRLARLLKLLDHNAVAPAILHLRSLLYDKVQYKDINGSYKVHITFNKSTAGQSVTVVHRKCEQAHDASTSTSAQFHFEWACSLTVDPNFNDFLSTEVKVVDVFFSRHLAESARVAIEASLAPYLALPTSKRNSVILPAAAPKWTAKLRPKDLVEGLKSSLAEKKLADLVIFHPKLPHSVSIVDLVQLLASSSDSDELIASSTQ